MKLDVINKINLVLSQTFNDYRGIYFFGSRTTEEYSELSDYDVVLVFTSLDYEKQMEIAGLIARIEYEEKVAIDYKVLTSGGKRSIAHIRSKVNPTFIQQAIDNGYYFGRV
ncbi:MAG: nucleotidyltransferase domain-containing protein [Syntrophomonadaceae bacterium]